MTTPIKPIGLNLSTDRVESSAPSRAAQNKGKSGNQFKMYEKKIEELSQIIEEELKVHDVELSFSVDRSTGQLVVRMIDGESGEVIREIPPPELLALAKKMKELSGILYDNEI